MTETPNNRTEEWPLSPLVVMGWVVIVLLALVVRLFAARGGLWLDEVYTLDLLRTVSSMWTIVTDLPYDTNHVLYTIWMYMAGQDAGPLAYRWPSVIAGAGSVIAAGFLVRRFGAASSLFAGVLMGFTHVMVHYGSEARGYSLMTFFALTAAVAMDRVLDRPRTAWKATFAAACMLGLLSHLLFIQAYFALGVWWLVMRRRSRRSCVVEGLWLHTLPAATCVFLYLALVRRMHVVGAIEFTWHEALLTASSTMLGVRPGSFGATMALAAVVAAMVAGVVALYRRHDRLWLFFALLGLISPVITIAFSSISVLQPRHFLLSMECSLLLSAILLGMLASRGGIGRLIATAVVAAIVFVSVPDTIHLIRHGRDHYAEIVQFMIDNSREPIVRVSGDHDVRHRVMVEFYARRLAGGRRVQYLTHEMSADAMPEWILLHDFEFQPRARDTITDHVTGRTYRFVAFFPRARLAGWNCYVYRLAANSE